MTGRYVSRDNAFSTLHRHLFPPAQYYTFIHEKNPLLFDSGYILSSFFFPLVEIKCVVHVQYPPLVWSGSSSLGLRQEVGEGGLVRWLVGWGSFTVKESGEVEIGYRRGGMAMEKCTLLGRIWKKKLWFANCSPLELCIYYSNLATTMF